MPEQALCSPTHTHTHLDTSSITQRPSNSLQFFLSRVLPFLQIPTERHILLHMPLRLQPCRIVGSVGSLEMFSLAFAPCLTLGIFLIHALCLSVFQAMSTHFRVFLEEKKKAHSPLFSKEVLSTRTDLFFENAPMSTQAQ